MAKADEEGLDHNRICRHIIAFDGDSQGRLFMGNWSDYEADYRERYGKGIQPPASSTAC